MNTSSHHPLTIRVPKDPESRLPVEIIDTATSLKAAFTERSNINYLPRDWNDACGFYVLFSGLNPDGTYMVYVGRTSSNFYRRMKDHNENRDWWTSALLMYKDATYSFNSTHSAYLEGIVCDLFYSLPHVKVENKAPTGDKTLSDDEKPLMQAIVDSMIRIMKIRGYDTKSHVHTASTVYYEQQNPEPIFADLPIDDNYFAFSEYVETIDNCEIINAPHEEITQTITESSLPKVIQEFSDEPDKSSIEATTLYGKLKSWRLGKSKELDCKAFIIMHDSMMRDIVRVRPQTQEGLKSVNGFSGKRFEKYGDDIMFIILNDFS